MPENYPIGFQIRAVSNLIKRKIYEIRPDGQPLLTDLQGRILGFLYHNQDREIFQRDIEEHFYIRRSTVSRLLAGMEEQGLLQRIPVPRDARLKKLVMTPRAVALHEEITRRLDEIERLLERGLSRRELEEFLRILEKIKRNAS